MRQHGLARFVAVESRERARRLRHAAVPVDHHNLRQVVPLARFEIVGVVRRRHLHHARAELGVGQRVANHRNLAVHQRQQYRAPVQVAIPFVVRMHRHRRVAQHRLRPRRRHRHEAPFQALHRVADVPQLALRLDVHDFQIRQRRVAPRAPVHHVRAAVNQSLRIEPHERFAHRPRQPRVHREAVARPVARVADALHLLENRSAVLLLPLPHAPLELLAPQLLPRDVFRLLQAALHHHLRRNSRVVGPRQPQRLVALHAVPACGHVDLGVLQHMADVQHPGHVGRWNHQRKNGAPRRRLTRRRLEESALDPPLRPVLLEALRFVHLGQLIRL